MPPAPQNTLYYGDNLDILRRYVKDESVDLVYLDPPFNSAQDYNVLFAERDGAQSAAQIKAFGDTWRWDQAAARAYQEIVEGPRTAGVPASSFSLRVSEAMQAFHQFLGATDMLAYLSMMAPRRRDRKPTEDADSPRAPSRRCRSGRPPALRPSRPDRRDMRRESPPRTRHPPSPLTYRWE